MPKGKLFGRAKQGLHGQASLADFFMTPLRTSDSRRQTEQMFAAMPLSPAVRDGGFSGEKRPLPKQRSKSHKRKTKGSLEKRGRKRKEKNIVTVLTHRIVASKAGELSTDPRVPMEAEIPVYDTVWVALRYTEPEAPMYSAVWCSLGFKLADRSASTPFLYPQQDPKCSAGIAKLAKKRGAKKLKMTQTALVNRMWSRELKLMVITEVDRLTADCDKPAYSDACNSLRARYPTVFDGGVSKLTRAHAEAWYKKGYEGVDFDGRVNNLFSGSRSARAIPEELKHIFLFDNVNHYWGVSKLQAAAERKRKSNPPAAVGGSAGKKTKGGES